MTMKQDRRNFIRIGGLTIAASGLVPAFLSSCGTNRPGSESSESDSSVLVGFAPALSALKDMTEGVEPLKDEDYIFRQEKLRKLMLAAGIDALWIEGGTNMEYFFDMSWWMSERIFGVVVPARGEPVWICPAFEAPRAEEMIRFGGDIRTWEEHESPYKGLDGIFRSFSSPARKVALDPNVRSFVIQGMRRECRAELVGGSSLVNGCRGFKSEKELGYMDLANRITKMAYQWAFSHIQPGMKPSELGALISDAHGQMGVSGFSMPLFGEKSAFPHGSRVQDELKDGDVILVDGGCSVEGYRSDVTRTIVCGTPNDKQKRVFDIVKSAQDAAQAAIRPGLPAGELDRIARKVIEDAGYGPQYKYFVHRLGHGIGMEGHEWPYLVKDNPLPLEPGMTFSNEPGIYIYGEFGVRIEDCFVVTEDGGRFLGGMLCNSIGDPFGTG
jgi:Xaa-Pro dipeptidase